MNSKAVEEVNMIIMTVVLTRANSLILKDILWFLLIANTRRDKGKVVSKLCAAQ